MKKFSTAAFLLTMSSALSAGSLCEFHQQQGKLSLYPATPVTKRLSPCARIETVTPASPSDTQTNLLSQAPAVLWLSSLQLQAAPKISAFQEGRSMGSISESVFVQGNLRNLTQFEVIRPGQAIVDPANNQFLGNVGQHVGTLQLKQQASSTNALHEFQITDARAELYAGDLLLPLSKSDIHAFKQNLVPHKGGAVSGQIASVIREGLWASPFDVVAINRGRLHGIDPGTTLSVTKQARIDALAVSPSVTQTVMRSIATLFVFDVTDQAALAYVMQARDGIRAGDAVGPVRTIDK